MNFTYYTKVLNFLKFSYALRLEDRLVEFPLALQEKKASGQSLSEIITQYFVKEIKSMSLHSKLIAWNSVNDTLLNLAHDFLSSFDVKETINKPYTKVFKDRILPKMKVLFTENKAQDFLQNLESFNLSFFENSENFYCHIFNFCEMILFTK